MISLGFIDENFEMVLDHLSYSSTLICQISKNCQNGRRKKKTMKKYKTPILKKTKQKLHKIQWHNKQKFQQ